MLQKVLEQSALISVLNAKVDAATALAASLKQSLNTAISVNQTLSQQKAALESQVTSLQQQIADMQSNALSPEDTAALEAHNQAIAANNQQLADSNVVNAPGN